MKEECQPLLEQPVGASRPLVSHPSLSLRLSVSQVLIAFVVSQPLCVLILDTFCGVSTFKSSSRMVEVDEAVKLSSLRGYPCHQNPDFEERK